MRPIAVTFTVGAFALAAAGPASAHMLKQKPKEQDHVYHHRLAHHGSTAVTWVQNHRHLYRATRSPQARRPRPQRIIRDHRWLERTYRAKYEAYLETVIRFQPLWLCIHSGTDPLTGRDVSSASNGEGSWSANTGNGYYGGLQMGSWFMSTYGSPLLSAKGTADRWTPYEQMLVADRAYQREGYSRGWLYGQWPNTAPPCGHLAA